MRGYRHVALATAGNSRRIDLLEMRVYLMLHWFAGPHAGAMSLAVQAQVLTGESNIWISNSPGKPL
ncbi:MAG: hypothetical protein ACREQB_11540 [Candidatus Binataceae bacterium]